MNRSALGRGGIILVALVAVSCNFTPRQDAVSADSVLTPTSPLAGDGAVGSSTIRPYVPEDTGSASGLVSPPDAIEPPADLLPTAEAIAEAINRLRLATGVEPLVIDDGLTRMAFARSADMVARGYLSHEDPLNGNNIPYRLMTNAGYAGLLGENVFASQADLDRLVDEAVDGWLRSATHRATAMAPTFHFTGVGLMSDGEWWKVTQLFAEQLP
jgi:uncharacterized protein YkwD